MNESAVEITISEFAVMRNLLSIVMIITLLGLIMTLQGCYHINRSMYLGDSVKILSLEDGKIVSLSVPSAGSPPDIVTSEHSSPYVFYQYGVNDSIQLEKRDLKGVLLGLYRLPYYDTFYGIQDTILRLSPDQKRLLYYNSRNASVCVYDLMNNEEYELYKFEINDINCIQGAGWLNDNVVTLVLGGHSYGFKGITVLKINVESQVVSSQLKLDGIGQSCKLSINGDLLAIAPFERQAGIKIIDLNKMVIAEEIPAIGNSIVLNLEWSGNDMSILFVADSMLWLYNLEDNKTILFKKLYKDEVVGYLAYPYGDYVYMVSQRLEKYPQTDQVFQAINVSSKEESIIDVPNYWGDLAIIANGKAIIYVAN